MNIRDAMQTAAAGLAAAMFLAAHFPATASTYYVDGHASGRAGSATGAAEDPFPTIDIAAKAAAAGDTVVVRSGIYREAVDVAASGTPAAPILFESAPGARVVVTGAVRLTDWRKEAGDGGVYSTDWPYSFLNDSPLHAHPGDAVDALVGRCEQVFVDGYRLRQVLNVSQVSPGSFFVDLTGKRLYAASSDFADLSARGFAAHDVEASALPLVWHCRGDYVDVKGITFRYAANRAQTGAVALEGRGDIVQDCVFEETNGAGAAFLGPDQTAIGCAFRDNGQQGFTGRRADRLVMRGCTIENNNVKNFPRGWEAGGDKISLSRGVVIESSQFIRNRGVGIWFDIGNEDCEIRNCYIAGNENAGIFYEISYGLHAHDNVIVGNGLKYPETGPHWGADAGIVLSSSPGCTVERNLIIGNRDGFDFREGSRTTLRIGHSRDYQEAVWSHDETVAHNILAFNTEAQVWGWFGSDDRRYWPLSMQMAGQPPVKPLDANNDIAAKYQAGPQAGGAAAAGLTLEKLAIAMHDNYYAASDSGAVFHWGAPWARHASYATPDQVHRQLGQETGSVIGPLTFGDPWSADYRIPRSSSAFLRQCCPVGDVPGATLGFVSM